MIDTSQQYSYDIRVLANGLMLTYTLFCTNHHEALATALAIGLGSAPLPAGGRLFVIGPCREPECGCGRISTLELEKSGEDGSGTLN